MEHITLVTSNDNKAREIAQILGFPVTRKSLDLLEIQEMDLGKIIAHKVQQAYSELKSPVMLEDVGFYLEAWNGFPGPFIKWLHEYMGYDILTSILSPNNRRVRWVVMCGYTDGKTTHIVEGVSEGSIATRPLGNDGWGFDTIFIPDGETQTIAQMGWDKKAAFSARQRAWLKLREVLN